MISMQIIPQTYPITTTIIFSFLMLLVGSVLSMMVYRLPHMMEKSSLEATQIFAKFNLFLPRSHCTHCKKTIPIYHNIPLLSYLFLRGRCHACHKRIAWRYPFTEGLTMVLSLCALYVCGYQWLLVCVLLFLWICIVLTMIDFEHQILPDVLTYSLLWLGLLVNTHGYFCSLSAAVWGAVLAYLSLWTVIKLFYLLTGKIGMGYGDFKLFAALGAWFGGMALTPILLGACTLGILIGAPFLWLNKKNLQQPIPFGPYLCIAGAAYLFFTMLE
jgi:leader peptidase (prepilin peptidase)/N-methyltransferase